MIAPRSLVGAFENFVQTEALPVSPIGLDIIAVRKRGQNPNF
jgi:hypothetical protein